MLAPPSAGSATQATGTFVKIKQSFLMFAAIAVSAIALLYGVSPHWFARAFLGIPELSLNVAHILRAVMCLYLALGAFWLYAAFSDRHRSTAVLTCIRRLRACRMAGKQTICVRAWLSPFTELQKPMHALPRL